MVQGPRVLLSAVLGGHAVGVYAIYSSAVRLVDQLLLMLALPIGMEISRCMGAEDKACAYRLLTLGNRFSWVLFVCVAGFLLLLGPAVFQIWTRGQVIFDYRLIALFLLMSACVQTGRVSWIALVSSNRMFGPSFTTVCIAFIALAIGGGLSVPLGIAGMIIGGVVGEALNAAIMILVVVPAAEAAFAPLLRRHVRRARVNLGRPAADFQGLGPVRNRFRISASGHSGTDGPC